MFKYFQWQINKELVFKKRLRVGLENMIYPLRWDGRVLGKGTVIICVNKITSSLVTKILKHFFTDICTTN